MSTMIVSNTRERDMLSFVAKLFVRYPNPQALVDQSDEAQLVAEMNDHDINQAENKAKNIVTNTRRLLDEHNGEVPSERDVLESMKGVGQHVSSVTLAWVHNKSEFGVDRHVRRVLKRWRFIKGNESDAKIENLVKDKIPKDKIGHFSRSFVDLGQSYCGYSPDCSSCSLCMSCPEW